MSKLTLKTSAGNISIKASYLFAIILIVLSAMFVYASTVYIAPLTEYQDTDANVTFGDVNYTVNVSVVFPENDTIYFNMTREFSFWPNITVNSTVNRTCTVQFNGNGTWISLTNGSGSVSGDSNMTWSNASYINFEHYYTDDWINMSINCTLGDEDTMVSSFNTTSSLVRFKFYGGAYDIDEVTGIGNNTWWKHLPMINITTNTSAKGCYVVFNATPSGQYIVSLVNNTPNDKDQTVYWSNTSAYHNPLEADYIYNGTHGTGQNVTYYCENVWGNKTWTNDTVGQTTLFYIDNTAPLNTTAYVYTVGKNYTSGGNYIGLSVNFTDNYTSAVDCKIMAYYEALNHSTVAYNFSSDVATTYNNDGITTCSMNITPSDVTADGRYYLRTWSQDGSRFETDAATASLYTPNIELQQSKTGVIEEKSVVFTRLVTGWNLITTPMAIGPSTLGGIAGLTENIGFVSVYENINKTFVTFTTGGTAKKSYPISFPNSSYVYVSANTTLMYNFSSTVSGLSTLNTTLHNQTVYGNTSKVSGWNIMPVIFENRTLNESLYFDGCGKDNGTNCTSLKFMSYHDAVNSRYCTAYRESTHLGSCWPTYTSMNFTIPFGKAYWVYSTLNQSYNLTRGLSGNVTFV